LVISSYRSVLPEVHAATSRGIPSSAFEIFLNMIWVFKGS
jgi:hypothetical protein